MKKLLLLTISLFALSCSNDDSSTQAEDPNDGYWLDTSSTYKYIAITETCSDGGWQTTGRRQFCVTDAVYNSAPSPSEPCTIITFTDVDGIERTGYYAGKGNNSGCWRTDE